VSSPPERHDRWLVVEGKDDLFALIGVLSEQGVNFGKEKVTFDARAPYVKECGGLDNALPVFATEAKGTKRVLGLVVDADDSAASTWRKVRDRIPAAFEAPEELPAAGWVGSADGRRLGVWLMPDNLGSGKLEDWLAGLIRPEDRVWPHAKEATDAAIRLGAPLPEKDRVKGEIHAWLAWRKEPGHPFGTAMEAKSFDAHHASARPFVAWFRRLYGID
jgi:hypothetical protein